MSFEIRPLGVRCNLRCQYCYQNAERDADAGRKSYDLPALLTAIREAPRPFSLFGGEPLLVPLPDLEQIWAAGLERWGHNSIQTNATLISEAHLALFQRYQVEVGISMDGPGPLNDARWAGSLEKTRTQTTRSEEALAQLTERNISTSLIITLHQFNATADKLPVLAAWLRYLDRIGVESTRLHLLEVDDPAIGQKYSLSPSQNLAALRYLEKVEASLFQMELDVFGEMQNMLLGADEQASCVWRACDPYTTEAVRGLEGDGSTSNCGRTNKDGVGFTKADRPGYERYLALYHTPQQYGGCKGCRFFLMCKGQCPGTSENGDWRNRTQDCATWKQLFVHLEEELQRHDQQPVSLHPARRAMEQLMLQAWAEGENPSIQSVLATVQAAFTTSNLTV